MTSPINVPFVSPTVEISQSNNSFDYSIPVVDISKFEDTATRAEFLENLEKALQVGFFAVVNPEIDVDTIQAGYDAFNAFFNHSTEEQKKSIYVPELHGQRGFFPGETALGSSIADFKEFIHIGRTGNVWPSHMDLEGPATRLYNKLNEMGQPILKAIALLLGQREDFLTNQTEFGENLMRALNYFSNPPEGNWAAEHTDIDLLTILPYASEIGLEVEIDGKWVPVFVPKNALIVNVGDMLEAYSNGRWPSCKHRVKCTMPDTGRQSVVFFIHPTSETVIGPLGDTPAKYPVGTRLEYLFLRLFSLGLLSKESQNEVTEGPFIARIESMVNAGTASDAVKRWFSGFQKTLNSTSAT